VDAEFAKLDPALRLACVESEPRLEAALSELKHRVRLVPFMIVAGDHALNDMSVDWKNRLEAAGHVCSCILHGLGEIPAVADYYAEL
jgi:sirohydrochlorin cobaltochelatase